MPRPKKNSFRAALWERLWTWRAIAWGCIPRSGYRACAKRDCLSGGVHLSGLCPILCLPPTPPMYSEVIRVWEQRAPKHPDEVRVSDYAFPASAAPPITCSSKVNTKLASPFMGIN